MSEPSPTATQPGMGESSPSPAERGDGELVYGPILGPVWREGIEKKISAIATMGAGVWVIGLVFVLLWWSAPEPYSYLAWRGWLVPVYVCGLAAVTLWVPRVVRRLRRIKKLVPANDGLVCPACLVPLIARGAEASCPACEAVYGREYVGLLWEAYGLDKRRYAAKFGELPIGEKLWGWGRVRIRLLKSVSGRWADRLGMMLPWLVVAAFLGGMNALVMVVPMMLLVLGMAEALEAWRRRVGDTLHCRRCDFQLAPQGRPSPLCPECGADWTRQREVVRGRLDRQPGVIAVGVGLAVMAFAGMLLPIGGVWRSLAPTGVLIPLGTGGGDGLVSMQAWMELNSRVLTAEERDRLARGLLDRRLRADELDVLLERWLSDAVTTRAVSATLIERYYDEMMEVELQVESLDETTGRAVIRPKSVSRAGRTSTVYVAVEGLYLDGNPVVPLESQAVDVSCFCTRPSTNNGMGKHTVCPEYAVQLAEGSAGKVVLAYWLVDTPGWVVKPVEWTEEGTPVASPSPTHMQRFVVELTIEPGEDQT